MAEERLRLLAVGPFPPSVRVVIGGQVSACRVLVEHGFLERFSVTTLDTSQVSNPAPGILRRALRALSRQVKFLHLLIAYKYDAVLIFADGEFSALEKGLLARYSRAIGVPTLMFLRGGRVMEIARRAPWFRYVLRSVLRGAHVFLCQGQQWQRFAVEFLGYPPELAVIVPNWTATDRLLDRGRARGQSDLDQPVKIIFVGWVEEFKGVKELLQACRQLAREGTSFTLTLVGDGGARHWVEDFVRNERLEGVVILRGWCDPKRVEELLSESDIFVLPSWSEGMPNALIEAMATGIACITTPVGVIPDFVRDREHARLVPAKEIEPLSDALRSLIREPESRARLGVEAHKLASRVFSTQAAIEVLCTTIERVIHRNGVSTSYRR